MVVASYISPKASKGQPSPIEGRGLVAIAAIAKDEIVAIKGGHIVDTATMNALPDRLRNSDVQIADGFHLVALEEAEYESVMLFINHSCEPNVGFAGRSDGLARLASASARRAEELIAACGEVGTPGLATSSTPEGLTKREREIAGLAAAGASSREIAAKLFLSVRTVDNHLQNVYGKLDVTSREELTRILR